MDKSQSKFMEEYKANRNYDDTVESYNQRQNDMDKARTKRAAPKKKAGKDKAKKEYNPAEDMSDEEFDKILSRVHRGSTLKEAEAGN